MPFWVTTFQRSNYSFGRTVRQTADVVFQSKHTQNNNRTQKSLSNSAWKAMWEQTGWDKNFGKLPLGGGFSSVECHNEILRLKMPYENKKIQQPSEGKPVIGCGFTYHGREYRATAFYKVKKFPRKVDTLLSDILDDGEPFKYRMVLCLPKHADFVSGRGVCGCIAPIEDIVVGDLVQWDDLVLKQAQYEFEQKVKNETEDSIFMRNLDMGTYIKEYLERKGKGK